MMVKVTFYVGLGSQKREIWSGALEVLPRIGEQIVVGTGATGYSVEYIHHLLPLGRRKQIVDIYVR